MTSTTETGHAKNVANFESLTLSAIGFGNAYNPSKDSLKIPAMQTLLADAKNSLNAVNVAQAAYSNAVAARESAFEPLSKLITRVNNSLKATDTTTQVDESAQTIVRKLQGTRASVKLTDEEKKALEAEGKVVNQISASQMSYDSRMENFDKLIALLSSVPEYKPNEEEFKVATLSALHDDLKSKNADVVTSGIQLNNARISRNDILYKALSGMVDIAYDTKLYIKSVFGASSPQYKQIAKLEFKTLKP